MLLSFVAIFWSYIDMAYDLKVSTIVPSRKTLCPASPSPSLCLGMSVSMLTVTVGRSDSTSPPTRLREMIRKHRYYDPLRLPNAHLGFLSRPSGIANVHRYLACFRFRFVHPPHTQWTRRPSESIKNERRQAFWSSGSLIIRFN